MLYEAITGKTVIVPYHVIKHHFVGADELAIWCRLYNLQYTTSVSPSGETLYTISPTTNFRPQCSRP